MLQEDCNSPITMMEAMRDILKDLVSQCLVIYIDDIIIYYRIHEEYVGNLKKVLE